MTHTEPEKLVIKWNTSDSKAIEAIRKRFGIPTYTTVNGFSPVLLKPEDREIFEETARRGYFNYRRVEWTFNGTSYSW